MTLADQAAMTGKYGERLYHSHLEHWRKQQAAGTLPSPAGQPEKRGVRGAGTAAGRNKKLKARNEKLTEELGKTRAVLDIAGKHSRCASVPVRRATRPGHPRGPEET